MENKLKLVWENNPDTPLNAQNLSKMIEKYSEGNILFYDKRDGILKFRANTKLSLPVSKTSAFFNYDDTLVSHDSKFYPSTATAITYRIEYDKSIAVESETENIISNGSFQSGLTDWLTELTGTSTISASTEEWIVPSHSAKIEIDNLGNRATLSQTVTFDIDETRPASISFYYKSVGGPLLLSIVGDPTAGSPKYWKSDDQSPHWESLENNALRSFPASAEWTRVEIPKITITGLSTRQIKIKIYSITAGADYYIDHAQIEHKDFCSSYTQDPRQNSVLIYPANILRLDEGLIDLLFVPKNITGDHYLITLKSPGNNALILKLSLNVDHVYCSFSVYDTSSNQPIGTSINLGTIDEVVNLPLRIVASWNKITGISLFVNADFQSQLIPFEPMALAQIIDFEIGGYYTPSTQTYLAEGIFGGLKINLFQGSNTEIADMMALPVNSDENIYQVYENTNNNIPIIPSMIDELEWPIEGSLFLWLCKNLSADECYLSLTLNNTPPLGPYSKLIGGFKTDPSRNIILNTLWDIGHKLDEITTNRIIVTNKETNDIILDVGYDDLGHSAFMAVNEEAHFNDDVTFNSPGITTFNNDATFNDDVHVGSDIDLYAAGYVQIGNIRTSGNIISSTVGDININSVSDSDISLTATGSGEINLTGTNINITKTSAGKIYLDYISVDGNIISTTSGNDLYIQPASGRDLILTSQNKVRIDSPAKIFFNDTYRQNINFDNSSAYGIGYQTTTVYNRSSGAFAWYFGGSHNNTALSSGGCSVGMVLVQPGQTYSGPLVDSGLYAGRVYNAIFNDVAECWAKDTHFNFEYGMVVVQTLSGVRPSKSRAEKGTIGIISNTFGYLLGQAGFKDNLKMSMKVPVAIAGRVKVKVFGNSLNVGDEIVSYKNGMAIKANLFEKIFKRERILGIIDAKITDDLYWVKVQ